MVCSRCGARVFVAVHELGAAKTALVLDMAPAPDGSIWLTDDGRARSVANGDPGPRIGAERYNPHPLTCRGGRVGVGR